VGGGEGLLDGSDYVMKIEQMDFGNSYLDARFRIDSSWTAPYDANFGGWSSASWFRTYPSYNCILISTKHTLTPVPLTGYVTAVPGSWTNFGYYCYSPDYAAYDTWYEGTSWSGVYASYPWSTTLQERTRCQFAFQGTTPELNPTSAVYYGE